ncbi:hypothetical protein EDC94DRAFT_695982 [Helicostylum pulchrum]|nr:hypothetical protein EDC94DRAFT_695982 [Helicostylum pulchrum]
MSVPNDTVLLKATAVACTKNSPYRILTKLPAITESFLQNNAFEVVGYVRKSLTADNLDNRAKLLHQMIDNLRSSSRASTAFAERDQNIYQQLDKAVVDETTQDKATLFVPQTTLGLIIEPHDE